MHLPSVISTLAHLDVLPEKNWGELWNDRAALLRSVLNGGSTVLAKDRPFYIEGHGYPETVQFDISYSPVRNEERRVRGVLCIVNDTTDRVKFESALQASEERLKAIFRSPQRGIVQTDLTGCFLPVNNRFCETLGYRESELLSMGMLDICVARDIAEADPLFKNDGGTRPEF